jgi:hypothetical protein
VRIACKLSVGAGACNTYSIVRGSELPKVIRRFVKKYRGAFSLKIGVKATKVNDDTISLHCNFRGQAKPRVGFRGGK